VKDLKHYEICAAHSRHLTKHNNDLAYNLSIISDLRKSNLKPSKAMHEWELYKLKCNNA